MSAGNVVTYLQRGGTMEHHHHSFVTTSEKCSSMDHQHTKTMHPHILPDLGLFSSSKIPELELSSVIIAAQSDQKFTEMRCKPKLLLKIER